MCADENLALTWSLLVWNVYEFGSFLSGKLDSLRHEKGV